MWRLRRRCSTGLSDDVELSYEAEDKKKAFRRSIRKLDPQKSLLDVAAAYEFVKDEDHKGIGVVGFCYGGLDGLADGDARRDAEDAAGCCVGYYAGGIGKFAEEEPPAR